MWRLISLPVLFLSLLSLTTGTTFTAIPGEDKVIKWTMNHVPPSSAVVAVLHPKLTNGSIPYAMLFSVLGKSVLPSNTAAGPDKRVINTNKTNTATGHIEFTLSDITEQDAGDYKTNYNSGGGGRLEMGVTLIVYVKPSKPVITKISTAILGQTMTLKCSATSNSKPDNHSLQMNYTWLRNGVDIPFNNRYVVMGKFLSVTNIQKDDQGTVFTCAAFETGSMMSDMSDGYTTEVKYGPTTVSTDAGQQLSIVENKGTLGPITCTAECQPECKYQWTFNGVDYGSPNNTLTVNNMHRTSAGTYSCTASNAYGTVSSKDIVVTVEYGPDTVSLNTTLQLSFVENTDTLGPITCSADCVPCCTYQWQYNGVNAGSPGNTLTINNITRASSGTYKCIAANKYGRNGSENITVTVEYEPGAVSPNSIQQLSRVENTDAPGLTTCWADCVPACSYQWKFNGTDFDKPGNTLTLNNIQRSSAGTYWCIASNIHGIGRSKSIVVDVSYGPDTVSLASAKQLSLVENTDNLGPIKCTADCKPACTLQWKFNGIDFGNPGEPLSINTINRASAGRYLCKASNTYGNESSEVITVRVEYGPGNVSPNTAQQKSLVENKSTLGPISCNADCVPACVYQWKFNGKDHGKPGSTLSLNNIQRTSAGTYWCIASNTHGDERSQSIVVDVSYGPGRVLPSTTQTEVLVENIDTLGPITCRADCKPACTYQWKYNGKIFGSPGDTLTINNIQRASDGTYWCNASNAIGSRRSNQVIVYVEYAPKNLVVQPSTLSYVVLEYKSRISLTCTADCSPSCKYRWLHDGRNVFRRATSRLNLRSIDRQRRGNYSCIAWNRRGSRNSQTITVDVHYEPGKVLPSRRRNINLVESTDTLGPIKCSADCKPACTYQWKVNDTDFGSPGDTLTINNIQRTLTGLYKCNASNVYGFESSSIVDVYVEYVPENVVVQPSNLSYVVLEKTNLGPLTCSANCRPPCRYRWVNVGTNVTVTEYERLSLWYINRQQHGNYSCIAWNRRGSINSNTITVDVQYGPGDVTFSPNDNTYMLVEEIKDTLGPIICQADCNPECLFTWTMNDMVIPNQGKTLTIHNVSRDKAGMYRCRVTSNLGNRFTKTSSITVNVEYVPENVVVQPSNLSYVVLEKTNLGPLTCSANCRPPCRYRWVNVGTNVTVTEYERLSLWYINRQQHGNYSCIAWNRRGSINSNTITVDVQYGPGDVTLSPNNKTYMLVEKIKDTLGPIICQADCNPECLFTWTMNDTVLPNQGKTLTIHNVSRDKAGMYGCIVTSNLGHRFAKTSSITVNVEYGPGKIRLSPKNTTYTLLEKNGTLDPISCTADCLPLCSFIWTKDGVEIDHDLMARQRTANRTMAGQYRCTANNIHDMSSVTIDVTVEYKPDIPKLTTSKAGSLVENETISLNCTTDSFPLPDIIITSLEPFGRKHVTRESKTNTFDISSVECLDTGKYQCVSTNKIGSSSSSEVSINVTCSPRLDGTKGIQNNIYLGDDEDLNITATIIANPPPQLSWTFKLNSSDTPTLLENGTDGFAYYEENKHVTFTTQARRSAMGNGDYGIYILRASNTLQEKVFLFRVFAKRSPDPPYEVSVNCFSQSAATMTWKSSFNGGDRQYFVVLTTAGSKNVGNEMGKHVADEGIHHLHTADVEDLNPNTLYSFTIEARNNNGATKYSKLLNCTTKSLESPSDTSLALIGGVAGGSAALIIIIIIVVVAIFTRRRKQKKEQDKELVNVRDVQDDPDDGMKRNIIYESAGPSYFRQENNPGESEYSEADKSKRTRHQASNDVYGIVDKSRGKRNQATNDVYAIVEKRKTPKEDPSSLYAVVQKPNITSSKGKQPAKTKGYVKGGKRTLPSAPTDEIYENFGGNFESEVSGVPNQGSSQGNGRSNNNKLSRRKNKDGLVYIDVEIVDTGKGLKINGIHGADKKVNYVDIDFMKRADPLPSSDEDEDDTATEDRNL